MAIMARKDASGKRCGVRILVAFGLKVAAYANARFELGNVAVGVEFVGEYPGKGNRLDL
jgi:hypothetical protein